MQKLLVNLPDGFYKSALLKTRFDALAEKYDVRRASHNTTEQIAGDLPWPDAILMWGWPTLGDKEFDLAANLKIIAQINTCRETAQNALRRGVALSEARNAWSPAVAEMALGLILSGLRRLSDFHMNLRFGRDGEGGVWVNDFPTEIDPRERQLEGMNVGLVGFGGIGRRLAELLAPFRVKLFAHDPFLPPAVFAQHGAASASVDEICGACDVVVLCAANTPEAEKTVTAQHIGMMRKDAVLVNVGRSMLIDMDALARRLSQGDLTAMLDVFDNEPLEADSVFRTLPNCHLTPHRAGGIHESLYRALDWLTDDLDAFFAGRERKYAVDAEMMRCIAK